MLADVVGLLPVLQLGYMLSCGKSPSCETVYFVITVMYACCMSSLCNA